MWTCTVVLAPNGGDGRATVTAERSEPKGIPVTSTRRRAAAVLRQRRADNRAHRIATRRVKVSDFLATLGADPEFIDKYGSPAGKHVAKAYREANYGYDTPMRAPVSRAGSSAR
jgi:hypothetical protein